jgi:hypothetical protein
VGMVADLSREVEELRKQVAELAGRKRGLFG